MASNVNQIETIRRFQPIQSDRTNDKNNFADEDESSLPAGETDDANGEQEMDATVEDKTDSTTVEDKMDSTVIDDETDSTVMEDKTNGIAVDNKMDGIAVDDATDHTAVEPEYSIDEILAEFGTGAGKLTMEPPEHSDEQPPEPLDTTPGTLNQPPETHFDQPPETHFETVPANEQSSLQITPVRIESLETIPASAEPFDISADTASGKTFHLSSAEILDRESSVQTFAGESSVQTFTGESSVQTFAGESSVETLTGESAEPFTGKSSSAPTENEQPVPLPGKWNPKRLLFSHKRVNDTPEPYDTTPSATTEDEVIAPEPQLKDVAEQFRMEYERRVRDFPKVIPVAVLPVAILLLERPGLHIPLLSENLVLRSFLLLLCLTATAVFSRHIFFKNRCPGAVLCGLTAVVCAADCLTQLMSGGNRTPVEPYGAVACLAMLTAKWGISLDSRGMFNTFRTAALDTDPPYLVTDTEKGACKQQGAIPGFYTAAMRRNYSAVWQMLILPLVLAASVVFAALSSFAKDRSADFFLNWSAILCAGATLTLPLCWGLPWARMARRLNKAGCAVAGWSGAERISRRKKMILTDRDLFPAGSVQLSGMKIYHDNMEWVVSVAAAMAHASGSGLDKVFDDLRRSELAHCPDVTDFRFYQEGGFSAQIEGETVLFGTDAFLRRMGITPPDDVPLQTGMYLACDGKVLAAFSIRYHANETVDYALKMIRRSHVTAILASRDPNITPALLHRKFQRKIKVEYPTLSARVELSEAGQDRDLPRGILLREGLLPYAEAVTASRRMCRGVRRATRLALFGSAAGTLLAFYLVYQGRYNLLTPLTLLLFLILWAVPVLLLMELT